MITGEPVKSPIRAVLDFFLEHPKLSGFLGALAFAVAFSPRVSAMASWISIAIAYVFAVAMIAGFNEKYKLGWFISITLYVLTALVLLKGGIWLIGNKAEDQYALLQLYKTDTLNADDPLPANQKVDFEVSFVNLGKVKAEHVYAALYVTFIEDITDGSIKTEVTSWEDTQNKRSFEGKKEKGLAIP